MLSIHFNKLSLIYETRALSKSDLFQVERLQKITLSQLPHERRFDISVKTPEEFEERMTVLGRMVGVFTKDTHELIAYGTLALPTSLWPVGDMAVGANVLPCRPDHLAVFQNDVVHPVHRRKGLHRLILETRIGWCPALGRHHILAQVLSHNTACLESLFKSGFMVIHANITPRRKCQALLMYKDLVKPQIHFVEQPHLSLDPVQDFDRLSQLLSVGYRGIRLLNTEPSSEQNGARKLSLLLPESEVKMCSRNVVNAHNNTSRVKVAVKL